MKKKKSTLLIVSMSFLLSIGTLMFSSCADKDDPSPILPTPEDTPYILKLKFSEKVEFKEILNKNDIQDLTETETAYFGERIQWSYPHQGRGADELLPQQRPRQAVHRVGTDSGTDESGRCGSHHDVHSLGRGI